MEHVTLQKDLTSLMHNFTSIFLLIVYQVLTLAHQFSPCFLICSYYNLVLWKGRANLVP